MTPNQFNRLTQIEKKIHLAKKRAGVKEEVRTVGRGSTITVYMPTIGKVIVAHGGAMEFATHEEALHAAKEEKKRYRRICIEQGYLVEKNGKLKPSAITDH